ncbi:phenylacetate-CoA oxygenase subunit PaaJ [Pandoraea thiooxydans]|uniref:Phenylacetate-CoA oxygenase subunit PaaJ n=1 Tax=Pandoraea thiooxydans TaxID=445709 RepID=A0A0G3EYF0_9BURK|nr:1,2-phenylacetyl-CoA epoxidase subunit PaaD [Pandoraea thiooxydans]AKJ69801.1 phenylacetate-CoA oxygenase subunit PaaJ [Pandoraea thiooxydans]
MVDATPAMAPNTVSTDVLARARQALEAVPDPEIPVVSIRELGILRDVRLARASADEAAGAGAVIEVVITPTYSGCPAMAQIAEDIGAALTQAGVGPYRVTTVLAPAWTTDWITDEARDKLQRYGIAPPTAGNARSDSQPLRFHPRPQHGVTCPHCNSSNTELLSAFGSTACKALYRCLDCREPFDYFKPY